MAPTINVLTLIYLRIDKVDKLVCERMVYMEISFEGFNHSYSNGCARHPLTG